MASATFMSPPLSRTHTGMDGADGIRRMEDIVNQKAGAYSSIYQACTSLKKRLYDVPGMEPYLEDMDAEEQESPDESDIVTSMWNMLRQGCPLMVLYNNLKPEAPLRLDNNISESKIPKAATFKFLQACITDLQIPASECFLITDLYSRDTTGFVKVIKLVDRVYEHLKKNGRLMNMSTNEFGEEMDGDRPALNFHENVIQELVTTERNYVQHLDTLQQFKGEVERSGVIPGDVVHDIFMNLNSLVDYQRRFLIRVEQQNILEPSLQNWGQLFKQYADGFRIYEPFIMNQTRSNQKIQENWEKIRMAPVSEHLQGMISGDSNTLAGFTLKPLQRLTKYPLLLEVSIVGRM
jgi:cell division control protein 24